VIASPSFSHMSTGLSDDTTYYFRVESVNDFGSAMSDEVSATTEEDVDVTVPATPTGLSLGTATSGSVDLEWDEHPDTDGDLVEIRAYWNADDEAVTTSDE